MIKPYAILITLCLAFASCVGPTTRQATPRADARQTDKADKAAPVIIEAAETPPWVDELVTRVQRRVSEIRGLPFHHDVDYKPLDTDTLKRVLKAAIDDQMPPDLRPHIERAMRRLGLLPEDRSLEEIIVALFGEQVAGLYDEQKGTLYVVTAFDLKTALAEMILSHETCHALQDQTYDLSQWPLRESRNDDRAYAALSVLEGDAMILMSEYAAFYLPSRRWFWEAPNLILMMGGGQPSLDAAPYFIKRQMIFPYLQGVAFMEQAIARGMRDDVLRNRPRSTEQILHPEKYFSESPDEPVLLRLDDVDAAVGRIGWTRRYHNTFGEMGIRFFLEANFALRARRGAEGWDGDIMGLYGPDESNGGGHGGGDADKNAYALVWETVWDTPTDAAEFHAELKRLAADRLFAVPATEIAPGHFRFDTETSSGRLLLQGTRVTYIDASAPQTAALFLEAATAKNASVSSLSTNQ